MRRAYWALQERGFLAAAELLMPRNQLGDCLWSMLHYRSVYSRLPNLFAPKRFSERLLRLKLSADGRSSLREYITDKELAKDFIRDRLGNGYSPQTIEVLKSRDAVMAYTFPERCAIKATHTSGNVILRNDPASPVDVTTVSQWFSINYYELAREPNYRRLRPKVIVEDLLVECGQSTPKDYKIFCFHGTPAFIQVDTDRFGDHRRVFFSPSWRPLDFAVLYPRPITLPTRPRNLPQLLESAERIARGFSFLRVDCYQLDDGFMIGELTNFPGACSEPFRPDSADELAGVLFDHPTRDVERLFGVLGASA
jgi:hypothetical protein